MSGIRILMDAAAAVPRLRPIGNRGGRSAIPSGALRVQPCVNVTLAEPPLPANADGGNLPGLDQSVNSPKVDLEVFQDFFCR